MGLIDRIKATADSELTKITGKGKGSDVENEIEEERTVKKVQRSSSKKTTSAKNQTSTKSSRPANKTSKTAAPKKKVTSTSKKKVSAAFDVENDDEEDFFTEQQRRFDEQLKEYDDIPELKIVDKRVQDVLEVMNIPPTFAIPEDLFMPSDLSNVVFELQAPYGFEQGQVSSFVDRSRVTVEHYVNLLQQRNEHIAKLATVIDKMQVDMNNLRYQNEVAQGVNIMTTSETEDVETQYMEARLTIKRLEDEIRSFQNEQTLTNTERDKYNVVQDQLAISLREAESLREENARLRLELENMTAAPHEVVVASAKPGSLPLPGQVGKTSLPGLPKALGASTETSQTHGAQSLPSPATTPPVPSYIDDDADDDIFSIVQPEDEESIISILSEDDDDEIDGIMEEWLR